MSGQNQGRCDLNNDVKHSLAEAHGLLCRLTEHDPGAVLQRRLIAAEDERTFVELARLRNRLLGAIRAIEDGEKQSN